MKDRKTIIESGMLEMYLLGLLPDEQVDVLEKMLKEDAVLAEKYAQIEQDFENVAIENAIQPPAYIKEDLFAAIQADYSDVKSLPKEDTTEDEQPVKKGIFLWMGIAAGIAAIFMLGSLWMFYEWSGTQRELQTAQEEIQSLLKQIQTTEGNLQNAERLAQIVKDPNTKQYALIGNDKIPGGFATAYINHEEKSAVVNAQRLPTLPEDKTYQMWADVDGEMINMGLIDTKNDIVVMNYIDEATSLNITIEPAGGSEHATVSQLVTNVYL